MGAEMLFLILILYMVILLIRNELVFQCRIEALNIVSASSQKHIDDTYEKKKLGEKAEYDFKKYYKWNDKQHSHFTMLFLISCWRFKDFYPNIHEELEKL